MGETDKFLAAFWPLSVVGWMDNKKEYRTDNGSRLLLSALSRKL